MEIITKLLVPGFGVGEMHPTGLASHGGILYMVGQSPARLYTLNPDDGMATLVGQPEPAPAFSGFAVGAREPIDIASHDGTLYMVDRGKETLYALDTETGCAKKVITLPSDECPFGVTSHEGKLYLLTWKRQPATTKSAGIIEVSVKADGSGADPGPRRPLTGAQVVPSGGLFSYGSNLLLISASGLYRVDTGNGSVEHVQLPVAINKQSDVRWRMDMHKGEMHFIEWRQVPSINSVNLPC